MLLPLPPYASQPTPSSVLIAAPAPAALYACAVTVRAADLCWPNCDGSSEVPTLNNADFSCFLAAFTAGAPYANCDGSTRPPILNAIDFSCFLRRFSEGQGVGANSCPTDGMLAGLAVAPLPVPVTCARGTMAGAWYGGDGREAREWRGTISPDASGTVQIDCGGFPARVEYRWVLWAGTAAGASSGSGMVEVRGAGR